MSRDPGYEQEWLDELAKAAESLGVSVDVLLREVRVGLEVGAERFGDDSFMGKDVVGEALEEVRDTICYALLETQKRTLQGRDGHHYLFQAALHAAVADAYLRRALRES